MSLYDELLSEYPLPDTHMQYRVFQTNSFGSQMKRYRISCDGLLFEQAYQDRQWHEAADSISDFHGDILFYAFEDAPDHGDFIEYKARFTDGVCQWIKRVEETT